MSLSRPKKGNLFSVERNSVQIENKKLSYIDCGKNLMNLELWSWGASNKGQLGLGDQTHRTTPTNVTSLNHYGVKRVTCGTHHAAALTIDGEVNKITHLSFIFFISIFFFRFMFGANTILRKKMLS